MSKVLFMVYTNLLPAIHTPAFIPVDIDSTLLLAEFWMQRWLLVLISDDINSLLQSGYSIAGEPSNYRST